MVRQDTIIWLWRHNNKRGPAIPRKNYDEVVSKIISELESNNIGQIDLFQLIDHIRYTLSSGFQGNKDWYILHVKQDLEARGIIKISVNRDCVQTISLTRKHSVFKG